MDTNKLQKQLLSYSSGFALSTILAGATKNAIDGMINNPTVKTASTVVAFAIIISGTLTFGKMIEAQLDKKPISTT